jgi:hypothetical protein
MSGANPDWIKMKSTRTRRMMNPDLSVGKMRVEHKMECMRILHEQDLEEFRNLFGCFFGVVPKYSAPSDEDLRRGLKVRRLRNDDEVRAVTCDYEDFGEPTEQHPLRQEPCPDDAIGEIPAGLGNRKRPRIRCPHAGLDFIFVSTGDSQTAITITLRFLRVSGRSRCVRKAQLGGHMAHLEIDDVVGLNDDFQLRVGDPLHFNGILYTIAQKDLEVRKVWLAHPQVEGGVVLDYGMALEMVRQQFG